ncbi:MAG: sugar phosphate nucleotidyltransferase [Bryobacteraceae bacterium]|nr:sugar phosphate nucleotidyltransferase [Bryobacteraceae bacterium]MDW8378858.1 mannose-1-phosphate guanylyltransferase [Bryobacterales bacterium]
MSNSHYYGLILAGGRGTRFWPRSRKSRSKQVLEFFGQGTLIQQTVERLKAVLPPERLWILTNHHLREEIVRQLPQVPKKQILAEPAQRNTAPAIGLASHILYSIDPDSVLGVFPADHYITKPARFLRLVRPALKAAEKGHLAVLGIRPRWPETGYGYIEFSPDFRFGSTKPSKVLSFREKPDLATAKKMVAAGNFCWNAGMFFGRASVFIESLRTYLPKTATLLAGLPSFGHRRFQQQLVEVFPRSENISIDYAVMEKAHNVVGLAADDIGWSDVGSWNAVYELLERDAQGNAARSEALLESSSGNYIDASGKLVALLGVKDLIIVDTADALLIANRHAAQRVGDLVKILEKRKRDDLL